ncbi:50S ribosomal protein L15 [Kaistia algarum]|jgi:large subunit ribosomal protein L15|uniref:50S ribosomal protein L15 n=1 Tax=Kaistia algarum TaxID=2083279 RepID=UPI000CE8130D|nr:50S ribosomal protein L15 [Kaistia algarum]MCX5514525.1 50S ribosomal protein L15 [Kaistia algarum]PPE77605.1 50S ribosomal protein L15 [Kaistia algarum]
MKLNEISDNPGAHKDPIRVGRGIGSGKGKTGGRGVKGQKSRTGVAIKGFEGGQMPLHRRLPKRGFHNIFAKDFNEVSLERVQVAIDAGKLDATKVVTVEALKEAGVLRRIQDGVRLLGPGELKVAVQFEIAGASKPAIEAVEKAGGSVKVLAPKVAEEAAEA